MASGGSANGREVETATAHRVRRQGKRGGKAKARLLIAFLTGRSDLLLLADGGFPCPTRMAGNAS